MKNIIGQEPNGYKYLPKAPNTPSLQAIFPSDYSMGYPLMS